MQGRTAWVSRRPPEWEDMVLPTLLLVFIALVAVLVARGGARSADVWERLYLAAAPAPAALSLLVPAVIGLVRGFGSPGKRWIDHFTWAGLALSVVLGVVGGVLIVRAAVRADGSGWPLGAAVVLAAGPAALLLLSYALLSFMARL
jgi:hypothetical protein